MCLTTSMFCGPEAGEVVVENDIEHPVQAVFDVPTGPHSGRSREKRSDDAIQPAGPGIAVTDAAARRWVASRSLATTAGFARPVQAPVQSHCVRHHGPLVMECWGPLGLLSCTAFWPTDAGAVTIAIAECRFRDEASMRAVLSSPETPRVMADVARFTDAQPVQSVSGPV